MRDCRPSSRVSSSASAAGVSRNVRRRWSSRVRTSAAARLVPVTARCSRAARRRNASTAAWSSAAKVASSSGTTSKDAGPASDVDTPSTRRTSSTVYVPGSAKGPRGMDSHGERSVLLQLDRRRRRIAEVPRHAVEPLRRAWRGRAAPPRPCRRARPGARAGPSRRARPAAGPRWGRARARPSSPPPSPASRRLSFRERTSSFR